MLTRNVLCAFWLLLGLASSGAAQVPTFATRSNLVVLSATAVDGKGRPVTDLRRDDFKVFEEGGRQQIAHFSDGKKLRHECCCSWTSAGA